jgi:hypothetical protein
MAILFGGASPVGWFRFDRARRGLGLSLARHLRTRGSLDGQPPLDVRLVGLVEFGERDAGRGAVLKFQHDFHVPELAGTLVFSGGVFPRPGLLAASRPVGPLLIRRNHGAGQQAHH